jgi:16S rRNA (guanine(966)-N(2))-methyltransferase RsmD
LRIIGGACRGRRLYTPKGLRIRPTSDRVKESIFNIIAATLGSLEGLAVLDIFAGTGNLGIEALSRGAVKGTFVDNHQESVLLVKRNLELTGLADRSEVLRQDAVAALKGLAEAGDRFGIVFMDPPYHSESLTKVLDFISDSRIIDRDSLVIAEFSPRDELDTIYGGLQQVDRRTYGDTAVAFFRLLTEESSE